MKPGTAAALSPDTGAGAALGGAPGVAGRVGAAPPTPQGFCAAAGAATQSAATTRA
jgi:hypothetical protein